MDSDATWYGDRPRPRRLCIRWGPSYPQKKGHTPTKFFALVYCGQTAGWIKMPLGTEVNLNPGDIALHAGVAATPKRGTAPPPSYRFMSVVAKTLDGRRHHLVRKYSSAQATLYWGPGSPRKGHSRPPLLGACVATVAYLSCC